MHRSAEALAQLHGALTFFEEAARANDPVRLLAAGRIAYALHNQPEEIRRARARRDPIYRHPGGPTLFRSGPASVVAAYDAFFQERPAVELFASCPPDDLPDELIHVLSWAFVNFRLWNHGSEARTVASVMARFSAENWEKRRQISIQFTRETLDAFDAWRMSPW